MIQILPKKGLSHDVRVSLCVRQCCVQTDLSLGCRQLNPRKKRVEAAQVSIQND